MLRAISLRYGTLQELRQLLHTARARPIFTSTSFLAKSLPPRLVLKEEDIQEAFVHGSGPGGQKINKTACAVQLKHIPTGIRVSSQVTRSRAQNRKLARIKLAEKVEDLEKGEESRSAIKADRKRKKKASKTKKTRRKYRALAEEAEAEDEESAEDEEDESAEDEDTQQDRDPITTEDIAPNDGLDESFRKGENKDSG